MADEKDQSVYCWAPFRLIDSSVAFHCYRNSHFDSQILALKDSLRSTRSVATVIVEVGCSESALLGVKCGKSSHALLES